MKRLATTDGVNAIPMAWRHSTNTLYALFVLCQKKRQRLSSDSQHKGPVMQSFDYCLLLTWIGVDQKVEWLEQSAA